MEFLEFPKLRLRMVERLEQRLLRQLVGQLEQEQLRQPILCALRRQQPRQHPVRQLQQRLSQRLREDRQARRLLPDLQFVLRRSQLLGFTGNPNKLNCSAVNPGSTAAGSFCAQVLALQVNCDFGDAGVGSSKFFGQCGDLVLNQPGNPCHGKRVRDICDIANCALGGGSLPPGCTLSNLCSLITCINQSFQGCKVSGWCSTNLCPVYNPTPAKTGWPTISGGCSAITDTNYSDVVTPLSCPGSYVITRTWSAVDACGVSNSCQQTITIVQSPSSSVAGKVVLACSGDGDLSNNQGINGATVTLKSGNTTVDTDKTDSNGNYEFDNLVAGTYTVTVTPPSGYTVTAPGASNSQTVTVDACDTATVPVFGYTGSTPGIQLTKSGPICATNGQTITYTFKVCNTGNTCLNVSVNDPLLGGAIFTQSGVAPGQTLNFTKTYKVNAGNACAVTNVATATGTAPNGKTATSTDNAITSVTTKYCLSTICGSFNSSNPGSGTVWCNAHLSSYPNKKCNVFSQGGSITITCNNGKTYTYPVPDCKITFDPSCNTPSSFFDGVCWNTTLPCNGDDEILLSACGIPGILTSPVARTFAGRRTSAPIIPASTATGSGAPPATRPT